MMDAVAACCALLRQRCPDIEPKVAVVLGSGLGGLAGRFADTVEIPYDELPGFPAPGVGGHSGTLSLARAGATPLALLQGRSHLYESGRADGMAVPIRTLAALGCEALVLTNAAGGLSAGLDPGRVMLVTDHLNFTGQSPLFGEAGDDRFVDLVGAYDGALREHLVQLANGLGIDLHHGVYAWFSGPNFETPAEVRAAGILGADAVGMSTVPEVILARQAGLRVAALSIITNRAAGLSDTPLSHQQTLANAARATDDVGRLLYDFLVEYAS
ncbi:MAG: purine-nucleoside phosphorylase [Alphaproteobacteria bacterium]|jgi:purine-nucleoside phosphorylase|nr:purine-nucleoside phosphorylase [Alphaproteobacteria bacterium]MDP6815856.1 purine-nucleoside phosphorylase [Alphaproteobacteria bacterium]